MEHWVRIAFKWINLTLQGLKNRRENCIISLAIINLKSHQDICCDSEHLGVQGLN